MQDFLPLFPLQLVAFPGQPLHLHVFEPRYKQLINECKRNGITFGIPLFHQGKLMETGTEMELIGIEKRYPNGEMDIRTKGIGKFKILQFFKTAPGKLYSGADIVRISDSDHRDPESTATLIQSIDQLFKLMDLTIEMERDPALFTSYAIASRLGMSPEDAYHLLELQDERNRQHYLQDYVNGLADKFSGLEEIKRIARLNGHFKNLDPLQF